MRPSDEEIHGEVIGHKSSVSVTRWVPGCLLTCTNLFFLCITVYIDSIKNVIF